MTALVKIIIGLLLLLVDIEFRVAGFTFDIVSDLVGFIFVIIGLQEILEWSPLLKRSRKHAFIGAVAYVLMRFTQSFVLGKLIEMIMLAITLITFIYLTYYLMEGILVKAKMEKKDDITGTIRGGWIIFAIALGLYGFASISDLNSILEGFQLAGLEQSIIWILNVAVIFSGLYFIALLHQINKLLYPKEEIK
ncbi:MAG: hypothetical protein GX913_02940 [Clostridiales bacterium]|nr:hypothetical protein [Clostridiales bacterium]